VRWYLCLLCGGTEPLSGCSKFYVLTFIFNIRVISCQAIDNVTKYRAIILIHHFKQDWKGVLFGEHVFFTSFHEGRSCTYVIRGHCCFLGRSCTNITQELCCVTGHYSTIAIPGCATMFSNSGNPWILLLRKSGFRHVPLLRNRNRQTYRHLRAHKVFFAHARAWRSSKETLEQFLD
jgi:hypothetical protein